MIPLQERDLVALLEQAASWRSWGDDGRLVTQLLEDMSPRHRAQTLAWIRGHAEILINNRKAAVSRAHERGFLEDVEMAHELAYLDALDPAVWVEDQSLVRRLVALVPREPLPARGVLGRVWRWKR